MSTLSRREQDDLIATIQTAYELGTEQRQSDRRDRVYTRRTAVLRAGVTPSIRRAADRARATLAQLAVADALTQNRGHVYPLASEDVELLAISVALAAMVDHRPGARAWSSRVHELVSLRLRDLHAQRIEAEDSGSAVELVGLADAADGEDDDASSTATRLDRLALDRGDIALTPVEDEVITRETILRAWEQTVAAIRADVAAAITPKARTIAERTLVVALAIAAAVLRGGDAPSDVELDGQVGGGARYARQQVAARLREQMDA